MFLSRPKLQPNCNHNVELQLPTQTQKKKKNKTQQHVVAEQRTQFPLPPAPTITLSPGDRIPVQTPLGVINQKAKLPAFDQTVMNKCSTGAPA